eukprot:CAMPEP_0175892014 /NCGR_PEP_ID=MMETSP0107_2-20121207/48690_1 /TAXON_ID=195067 ORGANISM="Goniomonas pacifica, Strain CCMP1869" /NCGR_SAMPLE_ID=MMETSP0107_2 /ASSEMBLY_ACC=CAM_ASM_000203 /LENGTH=93 /DNA_ID=CAMNT_0017212927 /DNA_START=208 /DNA_END=490 /DNA_ORIENTATION=+
MFTPQTVAEYAREERVADGGDLMDLTLMPGVGTLLLNPGGRSRQAWAHRAATSTQPFAQGGMIAEISDSTPSATFSARRLWVITTTQQPSLMA